MKNYPPSNRPVALFCWAFVALLIGSAHAWAIQPGRWVHSTEADFTPESAPGTPESNFSSTASPGGGGGREGVATANPEAGASGRLDNVVITNQGEIKLSAHRQLLADLAQQGAIVNDIQTLGQDDVYLAIGPETQLLRLRDGKIQTVLSLPGQQVFCLDRTTDGKLLLGISGEQAQLAVLENDKLRPIVDLPSVRYIWDMLATPQGIVLATGTNGQLLLVDPKTARPNPASQPSPTTQNNNPKSDLPWPTGVTLLMDTPQANLLCLGLDAQNRIYVGTDTDGLVYRLPWPTQPGSTARSFVLLDAHEPEVAALLVMPDGTVFAGTADADQARPGRLNDLATSKTGRPTPPGTLGTPAPGSTPGSTPGSPEIPSDIPNLPPKPQPKPSDPSPATMPAASPSAKGQASTDDAPAVATTHVVPLDLNDLHEQLAQRQAQAENEKPNELAPFFPSANRSARPSSRMPSGPGGSGGGAGGMAGGMSGGKPGNAVYRIDPQGFVTEVFRESVMVLKIIADPANPQRLLVATGNQGQLYRIDPAADETVILAALESQQIPAMIVHQNQVLLGVANPAQLLALDRQFAKTGSYTSATLDAGHISQWGVAQLTSQAPAQTSVTLQTRSGNVHDPQAAAWSDWSLAKPFNPQPQASASASPLTPQTLRIDSPPARYLQYRFDFQSDGQATPTVQRIELNYVAPNLKPTVTAIKTGSPGSAGASNSPGPSGPGPSMPPAMRMPAMMRGGNPAQAAEELSDPPSTMSITWEASDPNQDRLRYTLEYQADGSNKWINLAEDLDSPQFDWQIRRVPDGRYLLRVTASDSPDNPPDMALTASRLSDPVLVNNTPPQIGPVKVQPGAEKGAFTITATITSGLSTIQRVDYAVDSNKNWTPVLPDDLIFDSTSESVTVKISGLKVGPHVLTLRAIDSQGNLRFHALPLDVR